MADESRHNHRRKYKRQWIAAKREAKKHLVEHSHIFDSSTEDDGTAVTKPTQLSNNNIFMNDDPKNDDSADVVCDRIPTTSLRFDCSKPNESAEEKDSLDEEKDSLRTLLKHWGLRNNCTHTSIDELLHILRSSGHTDLPKTARTLFHTMVTKVDISNKSSMKYVYLGLQPTLLKLASEVDISTMKLGINIDGLPLFKSSATSLWPVLAQVVNIETSPVFPVCLALGNTKPTNLDFLSETIDELFILLTEGLVVDKRNINIEISHIVCDAPAKSLVKATKLYSGYNACFNCTIPGTYSHHRMLYTNNMEDSEPRTDASFRDMSSRSHHTGASPFCKLPIDMIDTFPVDYMHSCLLGVMKKLLCCWVTDTKGSNRLSPSYVKVLDKRLLALRASTPFNFQRKPRSTKELCRWKATEFRTFLVYIGKVVLKDILPERTYQHFLHFSTALTILLNAEMTHDYWEYAQTLLERFVSEAKDIYGEQFLIYNVHSLLHIARQAAAYGTLEKCSSFPFENYMQVIKRKIRHGNAPLSQIVKRATEESSKEKLLSPVMSKVCANRHRKPNNVFMTYDGKIVEVLREKFIHDPTTNNLRKHFLCRYYMNPKSFFTEPCNSNLIHVYQINRLTTCLINLLPSTLSFQCFKMECEDITVIQALSHMC